MKWPGERRWGHRWLVLGVTVGIASCSSSSPNGATPGDGGVPPQGTNATDAAVTAEAGSPGNVAEGGSPTGVADSGGACATPTTIAGTWDVQGSQTNSTPTTATLVIDASHFTFAVTRGDSLTFTAQGNAMTLIWQGDNGALPITTTHTAAALQQGIIPLGLGGSWAFASQSSNCQATIGVPQFTAACTNVYDLPSPLPGELNGSITGQRTSTLSSVFGDLGGVWQMTADTAGVVGHATFSGNTLSVAWSGAPWGSSTASVVFCDGIASGSTSAGVEFSAHLR
jgi:hypothetical protein